MFLWREIWVDSDCPTVYNLLGSYPDHYAPIGISESISELSLCNVAEPVR